MRTCGLSLALILTLGAGAALAQVAEVAATWDCDDVDAVACTRLAWMVELPGAAVVYAQCGPDGANRLNALGTVREIPTLSGTVRVIVSPAGGVVVLWDGAEVARGAAAWLPSHARLTVSRTTRPYEATTVLRRLEFASVATAFTRTFAGPDDLRCAYTDPASGRVVNLLQWPGGQPLLVAGGGVALDIDVPVRRTLVVSAYDPMALLGGE